MVNFEDVKKEYNKLTEQLVNPEMFSDWEKFEELSKRRKQLERIIEKQKELEETVKQIRENTSILNSEDDNELLALAEAETPQLKGQERRLETELKELLEELDEGAGNAKKYKSVIVEIRAGTGGDEASLFAGDLFRMYSKYGSELGWKHEVLDEHVSDLKGFKEVIFELTGKDVYSKMKNEAGVHRVQRIPQTEKSGRVHTSTATVAVLPKPKPEEIKIKTEDIKIDVYRASGPGGQNVNKRETAVRITHIPTNIVVASQTERNQLKNKENALAILSAKLLEKKERESQQNISGQRKSQIGTADRSEKIRTYNFPQNRVTDHRIKKSWHNIEEIMSGKIDRMVKELEKI